MRNNSKLKEIIFYILGIILIIGFVYLYYTRFINVKVVPPVIRKLIISLGRNGVFLANAMIFILFIAFIPYRKKIEWRSKGVFSAFILALFAEMFGIPLFAYIIAPYFSQILSKIPGVPSINLLDRYFILGWIGAVIGTYLTLAGMILVFVGWIQIHKSKNLITNGLYKYIRHPQYTGLFLIITGWILHWADFLTIIMYPILLIIYYRLAMKEEEELFEEFGTEYKEYMSKTKKFFPFVY